MLDGLSVVLILAGAFFFFAGTLGLLRFPDVFTRLHAITKADNLGLGLTVAGLILQTTSVPTVLKLVLIWLLALAASSTACYLVANSARRAQKREG
jgi:multicomponent Na+:H+ antiporter subunit G